MKSFTSYIVCMLIVLQSVTACVDYHPDSVRVFVNVTEGTSCEMEIRITNLQMFGGEPNHFCSCGIINAYDDYGDFQLIYVAFVDSLTGIPIQGFDPFFFLEAASGAWENVDPNDVDWNGFVSDVNESGILAGQQVDLVIRGTYVDDICEDFEYFNYVVLPGIVDNGGFGTDEWSVDSLDLALSHNDITRFGDLPIEYFEVNIMDQEYFTNLDQLIMGTLERALLKFDVYPNPVTDELNLVNAQPFSLICLFDVSGRKLKEYSNNGDGIYTIDTSGFEEGVYFLQVNEGSKSRTVRVVKSR